MEKHIQYFIVSEEVLPEAMVKTARVKEALAKGKAATINQAVKKVGISRSAFYKYRDGIFPFYQERKEKIITINLTLEHRYGALSDVINTIASVQANILTINQSLPLQGMANLTLSLDTAGMQVDIPGLIAMLQNLNSVIKAELVGQSV
ncbi:MAG: ACT domain-containing protein [Bacillota bacterium]|jgi:chorismate mutase|nr:ACT domain-containing protein [Clostridia bacterium]